MPDYKTDSKDLNVFIGECKYWIKYFSLADFEVYYVHENTEGARASYYANTLSMMCTIKLSVDWDYKPHKIEIQKVAFHEVCHMLIVKLGVAACAGISKDYVDQYEHEIIRRMENSIFKEKRCK